MKPFMHSLILSFILIISTTTTLFANELNQKIEEVFSKADTNATFVLYDMQKEKLITLKEGKGLLPTALDITDNPRHLQIMELEGAQLPRVLDDPKVDVAIISTTYIQQTGLSPVHDSVFIEDKNSPYVNILVAREDNKNAENVKEFLQSYQSPEVAKAAETIFNGGAVPGW